MSTQDIQRQIDAIDSKLAKMLDSTRSSKTLMLVGGIILVIILIAYFQWAAAYAREFSQPKVLSQIVTSQAVDQFSTMRATMETEIKTEVPKAFDAILDDTIKKHIPEGRVALVKYLKKEMQVALDHTEDMIIGRFDSSFKEQSTEIGRLVRELKTTQGRDSLEDDLYKQMVEALESQDVGVEVETYAVAVEDIQNTLAKLSDPVAQLSEEEIQVRDLISIIREMMKRSEMKDFKLDLSFKASKAEPLPVK